MFRYLIVLVLIGSIHAAEEALKPRPRLDGRIVGGYAVDISKVPYQISLQRFNRHICGGSLINKNWVLTAAHCTQGGKASDFKIRVGSSYQRSGGAVVSVDKIIQHPKFNSKTIDFDFSLLHLRNWNENRILHRTVPLPEENLEIPIGTMLLVSGWGETKNPNQSNAKLRAVEIPKVAQATCNRAYSSFGGITSRMFCAGYAKGGKDSCQGDSGGPLVYNGIQVGVVSWGQGCASAGYPGVYASIPSVRSWIKQKTGI